MPTYLEDLVLEEVSIVDHPANIGARVVLMKRDSVPNPRNKTGETDMATTEEKFAELEARAVKAEKAAAEADARAKKAEADAAALVATNKVASDLAAFAPTLPALLRKQFDAMGQDDQIAFMGEYQETAKAGGGGRVAKALEDAMKANQDLVDCLAKHEEAGELAAIKAELAPLGKAIASVDEFAPALLKLRKADPDAAKVLLENTKALAAQQKIASLFSVTGRDGPGAGSATTKIGKAAKALRDANPNLTAEKAEAMALEQNPSLYTEYLTEQSAA